MGTFTVTTDVLNSPQAEAYFTRADRRVMIGLRAVLEMLLLPVPDYGKRRKPGPTPAKATLAAYAADNPVRLSTTLSERKRNAPADRVAAVQNARSTRLGSALYDQVFSG